MQETEESTELRATTRRRASLAIAMLLLGLAALAAYRWTRGQEKESAIRPTSEPEETTGQGGQSAEKEESSPAVAALLRTIVFDNFRADEVYPTDIDGDGEMEYLFLQSPGIYQAQVYDGSKYEIPAEEADIYCLTAVDKAGTKLWQFGTPWLKSLLYAGHTADQMVWSGVQANSKQVEVAALRGDTLHILDATTGKVRRSKKLGADNYTIVRPIHSKSRDLLLVKPTERSYGKCQSLQRKHHQRQGHGKHWYADPAHIYDAALNHVATMPRSVGSGHSPRNFDLTGDGDDEILIGYEAYNLKGERLWRLEGQDESNYEPIGNHADQLQVGRIGPDGAIRIVYAGSSSAMIGTETGGLLFEGDFGHPQHVVLGDFRQGEKRAQIAIFSVTAGKAQLEFASRAGIEIPKNKKRLHNIAWLTHRGEFVNLMFPKTDWPGSPSRISPTHSGEGILVYPEGCPDGGDALITRDWGWPQALSMSGEPCFVIPFSGRKEPGKEDPVGPDGYGIRIADFDNDGRAEVIVHDRTTAWTYKPPFPLAPPKSHRSLQPVTGQGAYAF